MQFVANKAQEAMGPEHSVVEPKYKSREGGETMRALAWFGWVERRICMLYDSADWS